MTKFIVLMWNTKHTKVLQCFGPYTYESDGEAGIERLKAWPAIQEGDWEVVALHSDPELDRISASYGMHGCSPVITYYPYATSNFKFTPVGNSTITWSIN